jgi:hypothetical protein
VIISRNCKKEIVSRHVKTAGFLGQRALGKMGKERKNNVFGLSCWASDKK